MRRLLLTDVELAVGARVVLSDAQAHYLGTVLRGGVGEVIGVFDGQGLEFEAVVEGDGAGFAVVLGARRDAVAEGPCRVTLLAAVPKGDRWDFVIQKATELGVARIVPLETERSVVRISGAKLGRKVERWLQIAGDAARQSGRAVVPDVTSVVALRDAAALPDLGVAVFLDPRSAEPLWDVVPSVAPAVSLFVGPEGGFSEPEREFLRRHASGASLGPRVLRAETACLAALTLAQQRTGGFDVR